MRQVVLDTETTGLEVEQGHRVIEIGAVELVDRRFTDRQFHCYLNPERDIEQGALEVHGITEAFLADKPKFAEVASDFLNFVEGAELVIHNASFDVAFIEAELARVPECGSLVAHCTVVDTLALARAAHPGQRNSLDALCSRYDVDNTQRVLHGALLDAEILADVYLAMTGGQAALALGTPSASSASGGEGSWTLPAHRSPLRVVRANGSEQARHNARLSSIDAVTKGDCLWLRLDGDTQSGV